ncbi:type II toxin-antitoxin system RelE/ParE family toxin [Longimicrobium sp.]|uniref:type II toxin-antitoxin system RelE/ParE family toxin n=1 Tax=Longimicrobium sp. TaxID=2029185 RepID=UPI002E369088|nr:type II toxin-antitoxin system RelE/ParE family toxin [Longimicrobium sp.]HEX6037142.1 type II toxin-antitoxin system RelE/ParE family toxin [Longimicrobium sp.]
MSAKTKLIQFISLPVFDRMAEGLLGDNDIRHIQQTLLETPDAGAVIRRAEGLRKLRISVPGRGKRGGARLIYLYIQLRSVIYFVAVFSKTEQADLTVADYRVLGELARSLKEEE